METEVRRVSLSVCCTVMLMSAQAMAAGSLSLDTDVFEWGEPIRITASVSDSYGFRVVLENEFDIGGAEDRRFSAFSLSWSSGTPQSMTKTEIFDSRELPMPGGRESDATRGYYTAVLLEEDRGGNELVADRKRFFVYRTLSPLPANAVDWSFGEGEKLLPVTPVRVALNAGPATGVFGAGMRLQVVRLGRRMRAGAVEADQVVASREIRDVTSDALIHDYWRFAPLTPVDHIKVLPGDASRLEGLWVDQLPPDASARPKTAHRQSGTYGDRMYDHATTEIAAPMAIGAYEARVLGPGGVVLARRAFEIAPPDLTGAITFSPEAEEPYDAPPTITVTLSEGLDQERLQYELELRIHKIGRGGVAHFDGRAWGGILDNAGADGRAFSFPQQGPWEPGRYRAAVYYAYQNLLLAEREFEVKTSEDLLDNGIRTLEPPLELEDVSVTLAAPSTQVFGPDIAFTVTGTETEAPLKTGPLIAELYFAGQFTYGCVWREGFYTGARALVSRDGEGVLAAPGEPGRYEIRVFRPTTFVGNEGAAEDYSNVQIADQGQFWAGHGTELIGVATLDVTAPAAPGIILIDPYDQTALRAPIGVEIADPGPAFAGHEFEAQIWRSADIVPGGLRSAPLTGDGQDWRYHFKGLESELAIRRIGRFPFDATLAPFWTPGNYELRLLDVTTGLFIDRATIRIRDPGPPSLPAVAQYGEDVPDDWPAEDDPKRGPFAWAPPRDECVDPEFETPPTFTIVDYWPHDPDTFDDDEYRPAEFIWPGYPYFLQAEFETAPPDDSYRVRVDGVRRIRVARTDDDPRIYRSDVIVFSPEDGVEELRP